MLAPMLGLLLLLGAIGGVAVLATRQPDDEITDLPPEDEEDEGATPFRSFAATAAVVLDFEDLLAEPPPAIALRRGEEVLVRLPGLPPNAHWVFETDSPELAVGSVERTGDPAQYIQIAAYSDARPTQTMVYIQQERISTEGLRWVALDGRIDVDVVVVASRARFAF